MKYITVIDYDGGAVLIPLDNIAYVATYETITRIYLRRVAGAAALWYVLTKNSVQNVAELIDDEASE